MNLFQTLLQFQGSKAMNLPRNFSFRFRSFVSRKPSFWLLYQPYIIWAQMKSKTKNLDPQERVINPTTELVIDGFQGSANSFATAAFKLCQTKNIQVANHLHSPTQIIQAINQNTPVLLTIREPEGAIISLIRRWPHLSVYHALKGYTAFYQALEPYHEHYIVSDFKQTTQYLDLIIQKVNNKFHTHFDLVDVERANIKCRDKFDGDPEELAQRKIIKEQIQQTLNLENNKKILMLAESVYQKFAKFSELEQNI